MGIVSGSSPAAARARASATVLKPKPPGRRSHAAASNSSRRGVASHEWVRAKHRWTSACSARCHARTCFARRIASSGSRYRNELGLKRGDRLHGVRASNGRDAGLRGQGHRVRATAPALQAEHFVSNTACAGLCRAGARPPVWSSIDPAVRPSSLLTLRDRLPAVSEKPRRHQGQGRATPACLVPAPRPGFLGGRRGYWR